MTKVLAGGGKVWSPPPPAPPPQVFLPQPNYPYYEEDESLIKRVFSAIGDFFDPYVIMMVSMIIAFIAFGLIAYFAPPPEKMTAALEQEYGYSEIVQIKDMSAKVVTIEGEEKEVDVLEYQNATIFFENQEQMIEKIDKVQAGTYPEILSDL